MEQNFITKIIKISGMTCVNCENKIKMALQNVDGMINVKVSYSKGEATVTYDAKIISMNKIEEIIEKLDYQVGKQNQVSQNRIDEPQSNSARNLKIVGTFVIIAAFYIIGNRFGGFQIINAFPQAKAGMGYGMLFVIGLLTSTHCIAMCGGINLSQCVPNQSMINGKGSRMSGLKASVLYNSGRVVSYTVIGGIVGAIGSVISFSGAAKGIVAIAAGAFMVIMGLNMMNIFPWLRKWNPRMPKIFAVKINEQKSSNKPLYVGLLNGLMPCGPLQAMQLYALSTGDPGKGALSMLVFSVGTVPLMFGLGALSSMLSRRFTSKMVTVSAGLVVILGLFMLGNGMALSGYSMPFTSSALSVSVSNGKIASAELIDGVQVVTTSLDSGSYEPIVVQAGVPVQWIIKAQGDDINGCNNRLIVPQYNVEKELVPGDNVIEFTPEKSGTIPYSCWMGMIRSQINVVEDINNPDEVGAAVENSPAGLPSCCQ